MSIPDFDILACLVYMYDHIGFWYVICILYEHAYDHTGIGLRYIIVTHL